VADENRVLLVEEGILDILFEVFSRYSSSASLMNQTCIVTANVASFNCISFFFVCFGGFVSVLTGSLAKNSDLMSSRGFLPFLVGVLVEHIEASYVMQNAGLAVWNMIYIGPQALEVARKLDVITPMQRVLFVHSSDFNTKYWAQAVVTKLGS